MNVVASYYVRDENNEVDVNNIATQFSNLVPRLSEILGGQVQVLIEMGAEAPASYVSVTRDAIDPWRRFLGTDQVLTEDDFTDLRGYLLN